MTIASSELPQAAPTPGLLVRGLLLLFLPLVVLLVYQDSLHFDPALLDFKNSAAVDQVPEKFFPKSWGGLQHSGSIQRFDSDNLYEYVNGHAEFFISAGFRSLSLAEYGSGQSGDPPVATLEIYHMGKPLHAFGALMDETGEGAAPYNAGSMGFRGKQDLRFIHGPYYIKFSAFNAAIALENGADALKSTMGEIAETDTLNLAFPNLGETVATRFVKENYMGMNFLANVLERTFKSADGGEFRAFLIVAAKEQISNNHQSLLKFFQEDGIQHSETVIDGLPLVQVVDPYEGEWFYLSGSTRLLAIFGPAPQKLMGPLKRFFADGKKDQKNR